MLLIHQLQFLYELPNNIELMILNQSDLYKLIKLLIETKPIVCLPWEILHYKISREKLEQEPGFETRTSGFLARRSAT